MPKAGKRRSKKSSKRSAKPTKGGSMKQKRAAKSRKPSGSITRSNINGTAKKAAKAAAVAAGLAAVGNVLTELRRGEKPSSAGVSEAKEKA